MQSFNRSTTRFLIVVASTLLTGGALAVPAVANAATTSTTQWNVQVGSASTSNPTVQGFGYYPEVMTIDAGNT